MQQRDLPVCFLFDVLHVNKASNDAMPVSTFAKPHPKDAFYLK